MNFDFSLNALYFYGKIIKWVMKLFVCDRMFQK